jgi:hypothetical protein
MRQPSLESCELLLLIEDLDSRFYRLIHCHNVVRSLCEWNHLAERDDYYSEEARTVKLPLKSDPVLEARQAAKKKK